MDLATPAFGHRPAEREFWRRLARRALARCGTPFFVFSEPPLRAGLRELERTCADLRVAHWLSCKTQPLAPLLRWWRRQNRPIEVVSEFELQAASRAGFAAGRILVNGPAKHHWLPRHARPGLAVNFDSLAEMLALLPLARQLNWRTGLRLLTQAEFDPGRPEDPTQFGMEREEVRRAVALARRAGVRLEIAHFHLRTNVATAGAYRAAIEETAATCRAAGFAPAVLDCGGGWPPPHTLGLDGRSFAADFDRREMAAVLREAWALFPGLREIWLENGRFLSARSGALVVQVLDVKERRGLRQLICNGGRTLHALVSNWEQHELLVWPPRAGALVPTAVYGPTCMAFDQLARRPLPATIRAGDHLIWLNAGAYHLAWETQFSHGLAAVVWHENDRLRVVRPAQRFEEWWAGKGAERTPKKQ